MKLLTDVGQRGRCGRCGVHMPGGGERGGMAGALITYTTPTMSSTMTHFDNR